MLKRKRFHQPLTVALVNGLFQLKDYREYFNRDDVPDEVMARFGFVPKNPRVALIVGRRPDADNVAKLSEAVRKLEWNTSVVTYDDLFDHQENRLGLEFELTPWGG